MKLRPGRRLLWDIETDGLLDEVTKVHILAIRDLDTRQTWVFRQNKYEDSIRDGIAMLNDAAFLTFHNGVGFDMPVLWKLYGDLFNPTAIIRDTLVMCRMLFADQKERDFRLWKRGILDGGLIGTQGLEAWGQRLGYPKGDYAKVRKALAIEQWGADPTLAEQWENVKAYTTFVTWGEWNQEMEDYCVQDLNVNEALFLKIERVPWSEFAIKLEHRVHDMMERVKANGFPFDLEKARVLEAELREAHDELSEEAKAHFGNWCAPKKWNKPQAGYKIRPEFGEDDTRKHWGEVVVPKRDTKWKDPQAKGGDKTAGCPYVPVVFKEFNPNSRTQIVDRLTKIYDWEPQEFTEKNQPKVDNDVLRDLATTIPVADTLAELFYYKKRLGQLVDGKNGLIGKAERDGKIHPTINCGGTVTNRASHSDPNIAQVPRVVYRSLKKWLLEPGAELIVGLISGKIAYSVRLADGTITTDLIPVLDEDGKQIEKKTLLKGRPGDHGWDFRDLFHVPEGWVLMGADQKGIELRVLGHFMAPYDQGAYLSLVVDGDPHAFNQAAMEIDSRDVSKTAIYACVPMDTRVLTRRGWKLHDELVIGEDVLSYNAQSGFKEWTPLLEIVRYDDAPLVEIGNSHDTFRVRCTPNHRWFVRRRTGKREKYFVDEVRSTSELNSECNIIVNAPMASGQDEDSGGKDWLLAHAKRTTNWEKGVLRMSQSEREAFLSGFLIADGYYTKWKNNGYWQFNQNRGPLAEAAITASYLVSGNSINVTSYLNKANARPMVTCCLRNKQHVTMQKMKIEDAGRAPVWCIRTKNESFVMRQGDVITITGNTIYGAADYKLGITVDPELAMYPAKAKARGAILRHKLMTNIPALGAVVKTIEREARRGYLDGLDERQLFVRAKHAALNTKLQGGAATIAKLWVVLFEQFMEEEGFVHGWDGDFAVLAWVHDEMQVAVRDDPRVIEAAQRLCIEAAMEAGRIVNFACPVDIDVKFGRTWANTH